MTPIANFENYSINEVGEVTNLITGNKLSPIRNPNGYLKVTLSDYNEVNKQLSMHRLVALHFIPNPYGYEQVNHKDGNKENNSVVNLEWCSAEQNVQHALETGLKKGYIPYADKLIMLNRVLEGEVIATIANELPNTHNNTLTRMLRVTAKKEGRELEWEEAMKIRRRDAAIRNLEKING